jgi:hypothetical protein
LFTASGYVEEARLKDYVLADQEDGGTAPNGRPDSRFVIPVTVDDLAANGLHGEDQPKVWERSIETLTARKDEIAGVAVASAEQIEAYVLYVKPEPAPQQDQQTPAPATTEIVSLRSFVEDGGSRLKQLLSELRAQGMTSFLFTKVDPTAMAEGALEALGFRPTSGHLVYAATPRAN